MKNSGESLRCIDCKRILDVKHFKLIKETRSLDIFCRQCRQRIKSYTDRNNTLREMGFKTYAEYLGSDLWKDIRRRVYELKGSLCFLCDKPAQALHHNRYHRNDLMGIRLKYISPVCNECHTSIEFVGERKVGVGSAKTLFKKKRREKLRNDSRNLQTPPAKDSQTSDRTGEGSQGNH